MNIGSIIIIIIIIKVCIFTDIYSKTYFIYTSKDTQYYNYYSMRVFHTSIIWWY